MSCSTVGGGGGCPARCIPWGVANYNSHIVLLVSLLPALQVARTHCSAQETAQTGAFNGQAQDLSTGHGLQSPLQVPYDVVHVTCVSLPEHLQHPHFTALCCCS